MITTPPSIKTVLHVGCGARGVGVLPADLAGPNFREIRVDINPIVAPDIVASITDLSAVETGSVDIVYSSQNLEHLFAHEVPLALAEFRRVLNGDGIAMICVPDLQAIAARIVADQLDETAYVSPAGPISALDMIYGFTPAIAAGNGFMAHKTGFTRTSLGRALIKAGFGHVKIGNDDAFDIWAFGYCRAQAKTESKSAA
jgi:SAM-dependent methyltransferase